MDLRSPTDIGLVVRQRRRELGLDQAGLAERIGVSRQWVVEIEAGKPRAEVGLVLRALRALGLSLRVDARSDAGSPIDQILRAARGRASDDRPRAANNEIDPTDDPPTTDDPAAQERA